eukprot:TRINITY_DN9509_c0_g1_i1.p1 TRINITY_DN9509_c0_g1~~TRINITY_DN9509_c0_g1_i1.p1  ORF type:complete len:206 (-),score=24.92 TRINITY_DN9509_c0_g1_i1:115-732(-)
MALVEEVELRSRKSHEPLQFNIGDDDDEQIPFAEDGQSSDVMQAARNQYKVTLLSCMTAILVSLLLLSIILLGSRLPAVESAGQSSQKAQEIAAVDSLVQWQGLLPLCPSERFVVACKMLKLRAAVAKDSPEVGQVARGKHVRRVGPCQNFEGLVRVPIAVPTSAATVIDTAAVLDGASTNESELHGWATLTAEFVRGPRFLELP